MEFLASVKQDTSTTIQDRSGECCTEEQKIHRRLTEYCSDLYSNESYGDTAASECSQSSEKIYSRFFVRKFELAETGKVRLR